MKHGTAGVTRVQFWTNAFFRTNSAFFFFSKSKRRKSVHAPVRWGMPDNLPPSARERHLHPEGDRPRRPALASVSCPIFGRLDGPPIPGKAGRIRNQQNPDQNGNYQILAPKIHLNDCRANRSRSEDHGSPSSSGSRPSAITWPNLVILKSSFRRWFKLISFNWQLAAFAETYRPTIAPNPELSM
jgi:hypothetical protein